MKDFVLYTCLFGDYTDLDDPYGDDPGDFERICFTDNKDLESRFWKIVVLEESGLGPRIDSRLPKLLPHRYLKDFDLSLYVDGRIHFKTNPLDFARDEALGDSPLKCFVHPWRDCVYDEAEIVIEQGICPEAAVRRQMDGYRRRGYPARNGLAAGGILVRRHNDPRLVALMELWFSHVLHHNYRDQLSLDFCAWLKDFHYDSFGHPLKESPHLKWLSRSETKSIPNGFDEDRFEWMVPEVARSGLSPRQYYLQRWQGKEMAYKRPVSRLNRIANKYKSDKGNLYYNAHGFAYLYDSYFAPFAKQSLNFLEIGLLRVDVQARRIEGAHDDVPSLKMWREYFDEARIVGFDIADFSAVPPMRDVTILRGDMGDTADLDRAVAAVDGAFSIIVEDASHASHHQQIAFAHLFPRLMPGGIYVVEDLTSQPRELEEKDAVKTVEILRGLESGNLVGSKYLPVELLAELSRWIEFVHLYDSQDRNFGRRHRDAMAIVKKRDTIGAASARAVRRARGTLKRWFAGS